MATDEFSRQINHRVSYYAAAAVVLYTDVAGMMYIVIRVTYIIISYCVGMDRDLLPVRC